MFRFQRANEKVDDVDEYQEIAELMIDEDYLGDNQLEYYPFPVDT